MICKFCDEVMDYHHTSDLCLVASSLEPDAPSPYETLCNIKDCCYATCTNCGHDEKCN